MGGGGGADHAHVHPDLRYTGTDCTMQNLNLRNDTDCTLQTRNLRNRAADCTRQTQNLRNGKGNKGGGGGGRLHPGKPGI